MVKGWCCQMSRDIQISLSLSSPPATHRCWSLPGGGTVSSLLSGVSTWICSASCQTQWGSKAKWLGHDCVSHQEESRSRALASAARAGVMQKHGDPKMSSPRTQIRDEDPGTSFHRLFFCFCYSSFLFDLILNQLRLERKGMRMDLLLVIFLTNLG